MKALRILECALGPGPAEAGYRQHLSGDAASVLLSEISSLRRIERDMYFGGVTVAEIDAGNRP